MKKTKTEKQQKNEQRQKKFVEFCNKILQFEKACDENLKIKEHRKNLTYVG